MNRRQRRAHRQTPADLATYECPDCDNDIEIRLDAQGVVHLIIRHDTTCPWLAANERTTRP